MLKSVKLIHTPCGRLSGFRINYRTPRQNKTRDCGTKQSTAECSITWEMCVGTSQLPFAGVDCLPRFDHTYPKGQQQVKVSISDFFCKI
jgi:hypothetical protein